MREQQTLDRQEEAQELPKPLTTANIPTLLMVLVQLTGALHWLEEPYRLTRARGMGITTRVGCLIGSKGKFVRRRLRRSWLGGRVSQWPFLSPLRNSGSGC